MMTVEEMKKQHEIGTEILRQFMKLSDSEIKDEIKSIVGSNSEYKDLLSEKSDTVRTIRNGEPTGIEIWFYDCIKLDTYGISYKHENGGGGKDIARFSKHFKLYSKHIHKKTLWRMPLISLNYES